jgi:hypothetical protein
MQGLHRIHLPEAIFVTWRDNPREFIYQLALLAAAAIVLAGLCGL